jgi:hypothetical protein
MLYEKEEPPITFIDSNTLKEDLNSFYVLNLSIGMSYYQRGHNIWLKLCDHVLKLYSKHPHTSAKKSAQPKSHLLLSWWVWQCRTWREAVPHPGIAALK